MRAPIEITFLGLDPPDGGDALIRQHARVFERFDGEISSCHVVVDMPYRNQHRGRHYAVRIYVATVLGEIATIRDGADHLHAVIADAFAAAASELDARLQRRAPRSGVIRKAPSSPRGAASGTPWAPPAVAARRRTGQASEPQTLGAESGELRRRRCRTP